MAAHTGPTAVSWLSRTWAARLRRRAAGLGAQLVVDTSLGRPGPLQGVGGYYSPGDACVALAPDSSWGELVHEMTHLAFDRRVKRSAREFGHGSGEGGQAVALAAAPLGNEPLLTHWRALRARATTPMRRRSCSCVSTRCGCCSPRPQRRLARSWVLWDSALVEASRDLQSVPAAERAASRRSSCA